MQSISFFESKLTSHQTRRPCKLKTLQTYKQFTKKFAIMKVAKEKDQQTFARFELMSKARLIQILFYTNVDCRIDLQNQVLCVYHLFQNKSLAIPPILFFFSIFCLLFAM